MHHHSGTTSGDPRIRFWSAGDKGPRVLLVMGYGMRGDIWQPQIDGLKDRYQIAWFDNRGVGESARGPKPRWSMGDMADDALAVLDELGWEQCHLVGVSMGGMIAQEVALKASARLLSLSLLVTHAGGYTRQKFPTLRGLRAFLAVNRGGLERRIEGLKTLLYPSEYLEQADHDALRERIKLRIGRPLSKNTALGQLHAIMRHDTRARLGTLEVPTLIIKAGKDILVRPGASDRLHGLLPNSRLIEITDAGHGVIFQSAARVNGALVEHFSRHQPD